MLRILAIIGRLLADVLLAIGLLWSLGLLVYQPLCIIPVAALAAVAVWLWRSGKARTVRGWLWGCFLVCVSAYLLLPNPRGPWQTPWARLAHCELDGTILTIHDLRDFRYTTENDYETRYTTQTYDLSTLVGADFAECRWDGHEAFCHTMMSFAFADGRRIVFSVETRVPEGEEQTGLGGLYKRYGLAYVIGTEEDIFALRTNYRHEDLYIYPLDITPQQALKALLAMLDFAEDANVNGAHYNTVTANCSAPYVAMLHRAVPNLPKRSILLPVYNSAIAEVFFNHGFLRHRENESLPALRERAKVGYDIPLQNYSQNLRQRLEK